MVSHDSSADVQRPMTPAALAGLRVVELGSGVPAAYSVKLLADLGAEVVKVESPGGDVTRRAGPFPNEQRSPESSGLFIYLNTNKRGVVLDLESSAGVDQLESLLSGADVVMHNLSPDDAERIGLNAPSVGSRYPRLVVTSITPFGASGPHRNFRARDITLWNAGGLANLNGDGPGGDSLPPLRVFGHQAMFQAGLNAAIATMGAVLARDRTGEGQSVDVSAQECLATITELAYPFWTYAGAVASRLGSKPAQPLDFFACRDGWVFLCIIEEHQWRAFVEVMEQPELLEMEVFADRLQRGINWDVLRPMLAEWMAQQSVAELYQRLQDQRVPIAPVSTMGDVFSSEHLINRGFFATFAHPGGSVRGPGAPYHLSQTPWQIRCPAPRLGQHNETVLKDPHECWAGL